MDLLLSYVWSYPIFYPLFFFLYLSYCCLLSIPVSFILSIFFVFFPSISISLSLFYSNPILSYPILSYPILSYLLYVVDYKLVVKMGEKNNREEDRIEDRIGIGIEDKGTSKNKEDLEYRIEYDRN